MWSLRNTYLALLITFFSLLSASAQARWGTCVEMATNDYTSYTCYVSDPVQFDPKTDLDDLYSTYFESTVRRTTGLKGGANGPYCSGNYATAAAAAAAVRSDLQNSCGKLVYTHWTHAGPMKQGTSTSREHATEAEALYDSEQRAQGPFENNKFPTIHSWDKHECETHTRKTSNYANAKAVTTYTCTVTFSYSDTASPVAKTSIGFGATQDVAVMSAKSPINDAHWSEPVCSTVFKLNSYKANYGGPREGTTSYVCEIDYTASR
jgi:hypothetical protein